MFTYGLMQALVLLYGLLQVGLGKALIPHDILVLGCSGGRIRFQIRLQQPLWSSARDFIALKKLQDISAQKS